MLAELFSGHPTDFENIDRIVPEMGLQVHAQGVLPNQGRLIKSHECYRTQYKRAVYLVRDIRDVALSNYSRECSVGAHFMTFDEYLPLFLEGTTSGFGSWQRHVRSWIRSPLNERGAMIIVRFEDIRRDPVYELSRILTFLGFHHAASEINSAVNSNSLESMRRKEDSATKVPAGNHSEAGRFVRTGSVGGWKNKLNAEHLQLIDEYAGGVLNEMGYPTALEVQRVS
jgi:hypothetical protein